MREYAEGAQTAQVPRFVLCRTRRGWRKKVETFLKYQATKGRAINYPLSIINYTLYIIHYQLYIIHYQLYIIKRSALAPRSQEESLLLCITSLHPLSDAPNADALCGLLVQRYGQKKEAPTTLRAGAKIVKV